MKSKHNEMMQKSIGKRSAPELSDEIRYEDKQPAGRGFTAVSIILIIILGFAVYSNSFDGKFVWDDEFLVRDNVYIRAITAANVYNIFTKNLGAGAGEIFEPYRPMQIFTFMIDHLLWGTAVWGYHFTNTLLHIFTALAIFWLLNIIFKNRFVSLLTSVFYVSHPIHTQAVSYISGRADPLCALFMILAFIFYIKNLESDKITFHICTAIFYLAAIFSREMGLIFPAIVLQYHYVFKKDIKIRFFLPITIIPVLFLVVRHNVLSRFVFHHPSNILLQRIPGFFVALTNYLSLLVFPSHLHIGYTSSIFSIIDARALIGICIFAYSAHYAFKIRNRNKLIFFAITWFYLTLLPQSNLLYPLSSYMADHWLYLPSVGFFLILAYILFRASENNRLKIPVFLAATAITIFYGTFTLKQNDYWREPIAFYERTLKYVHDNVKLYNNLAVLYFKNGDNEKAISLYKESIRTDPASAIPYTNLGNVYLAMGKKEKAIALYKKALEVDPNYKRARNHLEKLCGPGKK
jgi:hypothetical protein